MKKLAIYGLLILNVLLLALLFDRHMRPNVAEAQARRPSDYLMIPADFPGARAGAVVVLDSTSGEISAIMTDESQKKMEGMPTIKLGEMFDRASGNSRVGRK